MPFWSRKPAEPPAIVPAPDAPSLAAPAQPIAAPPTAAGEDGRIDEQILLSSIADLLGFIDGADDDRLDPDAAVQIGEDLTFRIVGMSPEGKVRVRERLLALASEHESQGTAPPTVEAVHMFADALDEDEDDESSSDDARSLDLAVADAVASLELLDDETLDPDDAMKALELTAWHLGHLTPAGKARFIASAASEARASDPGRAAVFRAIGVTLDLEGPAEPFDASRAEVPGQAMVNRKLVVVMTSKGRDQAVRQSEALRQNGLVGRWEVPDERQAGRAQRLLREVGAANIGVRVVDPATTGTG